MVNTRLPQRTDAQHKVRGVFVREQTFVPLPLGKRYLQVYDPRVYRAVLAEIRRVEPDLVHVHNVSGATLAPFVACRHLGIPVVLTLHDHWLLCPNNMLYKGGGVSADPAERPRDCAHCFRRYEFWANVPRRREVFSRLVDQVRVFVSPSQGTVDRHVAAGYDRSRFRVIPYGIHPTAFQPPADPIVGEYVRQSAYLPTLLFAGALVESKGIGTIIEAIPSVSKYLRVQFLVAGQGEPAFVSALRGHSPMVIYESLLCGTPVLGADIGGIPELVQDGETGYVFPPGDAGALAEKVLLHFSHSALRRRQMRRRCLEYAHSHLTMDQHLDAVLAVYAEALGG
jgi:glycosyltransferase involved in cell wall biosynthesis